VNPALKEDNPNKEALESRVFSVLRKDLKERGILTFGGLNLSEFFHDPIVKYRLNRSFPLNSAPPLLDLFGTTTT